MEGRGQEKDQGIPNSTSYNQPQINQESLLKSPLATIVSTPPDRRGNATASTHRCSPTLSHTQTIDHLYHQVLSNPPPPQQPLEKEKYSTPDPDPDRVHVARTITDGASNSKMTPPPTPPPQLQESPPQAEAAASTSVKYRECLKNHAASMGNHVVDGCGEFMPSGEDCTSNALRCAACDCHRNFHRKEVKGEQPHRNSHRNPRLIINSDQNPPVMDIKLIASASTPQVVANLGRNGGAAVADQSSSEDLNMFQSIHVGVGHALIQPSSSSGSKKRFRTKFNQEQKDRMHEYANKLEWRIPKQDDQEMQQF